MQWDLLIRGAKVFDGSGASGRLLDVAVRDGRIAAQGAGLPTQAAAEVHDAAGSWLVPGLLDIHTHEDLEVELELVNRSDGVVNGVYVAGRRLWDGHAFTDAFGKARGARAHRGMIGTRRLGLTVWLAAMAMPAALAENRDVYVSTGEHGELSFSDVAVPGAERMVLETAEPLEDPIAEVERRIQQALMVANDLQASRLAREQARAESRARATAARTQAPPQVVYQDRWVSPLFLAPPRHRRPGHRGGDFRPPFRPPEPLPPPEEPSRARAFPSRD